MALGTSLKRMGAPSENIRENTSGKRDYVLDDARNYEREHSESDRSTIAAKIGKETDKILPRRRFRWFFGG